MKRASNKLPRASARGSQGTFGIDTKKRAIRKDPPKKRKPKFSAGAELKKSVE